MGTLQATVHNPRQLLFTPNPVIKGSAKIKPTADNTAENNLTLPGRTKKALAFLNFKVLTYSEMLLTSLLNVLKLLCELHDESPNQAMMKDRIDRFSLYKNKCG